MEITKDTPLKEVLEIGKECGRRNMCCTFGSGCMAGDDIKNIANFFGISKKELKERYLEETERLSTRLLRPRIIRKNKPYGSCVFFDGKGCKIHPVKPLECRISKCGKHGEELSKWFMLNYCFNANDAESVRQYIIYIKTNKALKGGELEKLVPKERLRKILIYEVLK